MSVEFPIKLDDDRTLRGVDRYGTGVHFEDFVAEGERVGIGEIPEDDEDRDPRPPYGVVVRKPDGLWIVAEQVPIIAAEFHKEYEAFSEAHGWETQERSRVAFEDLPVENRATMIDTVQALLDRGVIEGGARA